MNAAEILAIYNGSNGEATKALYAKLSALGPIGVIAMNLFRACKASERAKLYRGGGYRGLAYERKQWSMDNLCEALSENGDAYGIAWGWGIDRAQEFHRHVLYVEIPPGQVSFHTAVRGKGPDYPGGWDGVRQAAPRRIAEWCAALLGEKTVRQDVSVGVG